MFFKLGSTAVLESGHCQTHYWTLLDTNVCKVGKSLKLCFAHTVCVLLHIVLSDVARITNNPFQGDQFGEGVKHNNLDVTQDGVGLELPEIQALQNTTVNYSARSVSKQSKCYCKTHII